MLPLSLLCLLQFFPVIISQAVQPQIVFYSQTGCKGDIVRDDRGSTTFPLNQYRFESYNYTELWLIQPCNSDNILSCEIPIPKKGIHVCIDSNFQDYSYLHLSRRSDDLIQNKINLYSGSRLNGTHDSLTTDINRKNLTIHSLFFTGNYSWTIFEGEEYSGKSYCIPADESTYETGFGATMRLHLNVTMGSLRQGCHGEDVIPTEKPIDEGGTTTTDGGNTGGGTILGGCGLVQMLIICVYAMY